MQRRAWAAALAASGLGLILLSPVTAAPTAVSDAEAVASESRPRCMGLRATIVGTKKNDVLMGTNRRDVIVALGGHDGIDGRGKRDVICGGPGNDFVAGGKGRDRLSGDRGRDLCLGEGREHRQHRKCEAHIPEVVLPEPPGPPTRAGAGEITSEAVSPRDMARRTGGPGVTGDNWFSYEDPLCVSGASGSGSGQGEVHYGNLWLVGDITQPSYVYSVSMASYFDTSTGRMTPPSVVVDRGYYEVPNDGNFHAIAGGAWILPQVSAPTFSVHYHGVLWWDGTQWVDPLTYAVNWYHGPVSYIKYCIS